MENRMEKRMGKKSDGKLESIGIYQNLSESNFIKKSVSYFELGLSFFARIVIELREAAVTIVRVFLSVKCDSSTLASMFSRTLPFLKP